MKVFTAQQMRDFDRAASEDYGIPSIVLMENAALRVVEFLEAKFAPLSEKKILILCGKGNNGGDGLAIARHLSGHVKDLRVHLFCEIEEMQNEAAQNATAFMKAWKAHRSPVVFGKTIWGADLERAGDAIVHSEEMHTAREELEDADIVLDAIAGTGFEGEPRTARLKAALKLINLTTATRVAVDIASGLNSDSGIAAQNAAWARYTVSFAAPKRGFFLNEGLQRSGEIWIGGIGTTPSEMNVKTGAYAFNLEFARLTSLKLHRAQDAHKGDTGRALIVGGSFGMSGSICLASKAALATGAGLVSAAVPERVLPIFAASVLEAVSHPLPQDESGHLVESAAATLPALWKEVQVVALGPGLGRTDEAFEFARRVVRECPVPLVIDADALHALPAIADEVKAREAPTILTPHPGEMGVLMDSNAKAVNDARFETVAACAREYGAIVVLKGARTLVCDSGGEIWVNLTGNPGMATGGAGDVLTGTVAGLLAQLKDADAAAKLGVYLHGMAGDLAFESAGNGLVAGDIAAHLPAALLEIKNREVERINGRLRRLE